MTPRERARRAARLAAYGSETARTPADYKLKEALTMMAKQDGAAKQKKRRRYEKELIVRDEAIEPAFGEVSE